MQKVRLTQETPEFHTVIELDFKNRTLRRYPTAIGL